MADISREKMNERLDDRCFKTNHRLLLMPGRDLFEACRNGGLNKVKKLVQSDNVNAKDTREESHPHMISTSAGIDDVKLNKFCFDFVLVMF